MMYYALKWLGCIKFGQLTGQRDSKEGKRKGQGKIGKKAKEIGNVVIEIPDLSLENSHVVIAHLEGLGFEFYAFNLWVYTSCNISKAIL